MQINCNAPPPAQRQTPALDRTPGHQNSLVDKQMGTTFAEVMIPETPDYRTDQMYRTSLMRSGQINVKRVSSCTTQAGTVTATVWAGESEIRPADTMRSPL